MEFWKEQELKEKAFLIELTELTRKHGIQVVGCGCCGSPSLYPLQPGEEFGHYGNANSVCDFEWIVNEDAFRFSQASVSMKPETTFGTEPGDVAVVVLPVKLSGMLEARLECPGCGKGIWIRVERDEDTPR
jgi:hypothetical protein